MRGCTRGIQQDLILDILGRVRNPAFAIRAGTKHFLRPKLRWKWAENRGKRSAGGEGTLSLCAPSAEGEHLHGGLLDPGGGPGPLPQRPPAVRGRPALPVVAQSPGGAGALGHPGEAWGGASGAGLQGAHWLS